MEKNLKQVRSDILRVVLYGPESTGKTTLVKQLATHYDTVYVKEFARDYLQKKWDKKKEICDKSDLPVIANGQIELENQSILKARKVIFCDTNILITRVWSETHFDGYCDPKIIQYCNNFIYDFYLLTGIDVPWKKDDLRDSPNNRQKMFDYYKNQLDKLEENYVFLEGDKYERLKRAILEVDKLIKNHNKFSNF